MQSLRLVVDGSGARIEDQRLPMPRVKGPFDTAGYYRRSRGEEPLVERAYVGARSIRTITLTASPESPSALRDLTGGLFVVSGGLTVTDAIPAHQRLLRRGDFLVLRGSGDAARFLAASEDTRLMHIDLTDDGIDAPGKWTVPDGSSTPAASTPNLKRMLKSSDDVTFFHDFAALFADAPNRWSAPRPVRGMFFIEFVDQDIIGMHPEVLNQLVLVLTGGMELEVSGDHKVDLFKPGDIVLAADRTGEGHIDRFHGDTALAILVMEDEHLW